MEPKGAGPKPPVTGFVKVLINGGEEFCDEGGVSGFRFPSML
jgi:hypothetical protein